MTPSVEWLTVGRGAALALAIAVPAILGAEVLDTLVDIDPESDVVFLFYLVVMAGLVLGGRRAGGRRPDTPLTHGALAALAAYGILALAVTVVRLAAGDGVDVIALVFNALIAASAGMLGGLVAGRRAGVTRSEPPPPG